MINIFWSIPHRFFHNAIAWPELNFIFNGHDSSFILKCRFIFFVEYYAKKGFNFSYILSFPPFYRHVEDMYL